MANCKNCGNPVDSDNDLCGLCKNKSSISVPVPDKKSRPWTLSKSRLYPLNMIFLILLGLTMHISSGNFFINVTNWFDLNGYEKLIIMVVPAALGILAFKKEGTNLLNTIGFMGLIFAVIYLLVIINANPL